MVEVQLPIRLQVPGQAPTPLGPMLGGTDIKTRTHIRLVWSYRLRRLQPLLFCQLGLLVLQILSLDLILFLRTLKRIRITEI